MEHHKKVLAEEITDFMERDPQGWEKLHSYEVEEKSFRQDWITPAKSKQKSENMISYPLMVKPSEKELRKLEVAEFYDTTCYLGAMTVVARKINEHFHDAVQEFFAIDKATKESKDKKIQFRRGPIKLFERCKAKTENDYAGEYFPTSARVGDIVRCSLVFKECRDCVDAIDKLKKEVNDNKESCLKSVVRIKNM